MKRPALILPLLLFAFAGLWLVWRDFPAPDERFVSLESRSLRLGPEGPREWADEDPRPIHSPRYEGRFHLESSDSPWALSLRQEGVKRQWPIFLNDTRIGALASDETALEHLVDIPAGLLRAGENVLRVEAPTQADDIVLGPISLIEASREDWLGSGRIEVSVVDAADGRGLPCRVTVTRPDGTLAALSAEPEEEVADRPGVVYAREGHAFLSLAAGDYEIRAGRGFEWGLASARVRVRGGSTRSLSLALTREVDTVGWVAVDSHIHTRTFSGHGDATLRERVLTIAGEGIELAVATEHNHHADYGPAALGAGLGDRFSSVVGNEVTTKQGHFNAFPIEAGAAVVDSAETEWSRLLPAIRATPGVRVVTLNHPRDLHSGFVPLGEAEFDASTGIHRREANFRVDAIEVITSGAMQSDIHRLYRDWFALLNRGHRISAVATSDSHDLTRFLLGQGRTYVAAPDDEPGRLDLDAVWASYESGRVLASLGLLARILVDGRFAVGDLATGLGETIRVEVSVQGPSWTRLDRVELYANGARLREAEVADPGRAGEKARIVWELPRPGYDVHLVAIATGPGISDPYWPIPRPYQPTSPVFVPRVVGSTNPVWIDGDGNGRYESAREIAERLLRDPEPEGKGRAMADAALADPAVAAQVRAFRTPPAPPGGG